MLPASDLGTAVTNTFDRNQGLKALRLGAVGSAAIAEIHGSKIKTMPRKKELIEGGPKTPPDRPRLDLSVARIREQIRRARKQGYGAHGQIKALLSSGQFNSEQIKDALAKFGDADHYPCENRGHASGRFS